MKRCAEHQRLSSPAGARGGVGVRYPNRQRGIGPSATGEEVSARFRGDVLSIELDGTTAFP